MLDRLCLLFHRRHEACEISTGGDCSAVIGYKKMGGEIYIISIKYIPAVNAKAEGGEG
jgi:hypothetical protein